MSEPTNPTATTEPVAATPAAPGTTADASRDAQDDLTASVGRRLEREPKASFWKRLLGKS